MSYPTTSLLGRPRGADTLRWLTAALAFGIALLGVRTNAQEWSRFRGPNGSGVSTANIPAKWTDVRPLVALVHQLVVQSIDVTSGAASSSRVI